MKKVITYGSFDLFHEGHYKLLKRAKELGDYLIVGVTSEQYDKYRGKLNVIDSLMTRIENVRRTGFADEIIIENNIGQKVEDIVKYKVDIFTVGSDWAGTFDYIKDYCDVVYLERTKDISSTMLRNEKYKIIRLGIIGSGRIAKRFVKEIKSVSGISANYIYNPNLESARIFSENNKLDGYTNNLDELFTKVDAVYIASPHETHYNYIIKSLKKEKHVLCEKPLVLARNEAEQVYKLARENNLVLMEAIKTAYCPGFNKLVSISKSGCIGNIRDVEACFTKLTYGHKRELRGRYAGSFFELATYPLIAIIKMLGTNYKDIRFESVVDEHGIDIYTKAYLKYDNSLATAKVGLGVKSEGQLIISGTNGYIVAESPWWKTQSFDIRFENTCDNERFFEKFLGDGLRYEINDFALLINGQKNRNCKLTEEESITLAEIMEKYKNKHNLHTIRN